jgi:hypothetical protein
MNVRNSAQSQLSTHTLNDRMQYIPEVKGNFLNVRSSVARAI